MNTLSLIQLLSCSLAFTLPQAGATPPRVLDPRALIAVGTSGGVRLEVHRVHPTDTLQWTLLTRDQETLSQGLVVLSSTRTVDSVRLDLEVPRYGLYLLSARLSGDTSGLRTTVAFLPQAASDPRFGLHMKSLSWIPPIGVGSVRLWDTYTMWADLEPTRGVYNWSRLDTFVADARRHGITVLLTLGMTPRWASSEPTQPSPYGPRYLGASALPSDMADWEAFVQAVLTRYGHQLDAVEIWNEPNYAFLRGGAHAYAALLSHATAVTSRFQGPTVLAPAVAGVNPVRFIDSVAQLAPDTKLDAFSQHFYPPGPSGPETLLATLRHADSTLVQLRWPRSIWNTESGYWPAPRVAGWPMSVGQIDSAAPREFAPNWVRGWPFRPVAEDSIAAFLPREYALLLGEGVKRVYWYQYSGHDFAMTDSTGAPSAAVVTYAALAARVTGLTQTSVLADGPAVFAYRFSDGPRTVLVAWSVAPGGTSWEPPNARAYAIYDVWGNQIADQASPATAVRLGPAPVYLEAR